MRPQTNRPILGAERKETPPGQGEVSEVNMSPYHRAHLHCSAAEAVTHSQIATYLVRQARRTNRRTGSRQSSALAPVEGGASCR